MKYSYSRLSSDSVLTIIKSSYSLPDQINCKYYVFGLHDNYLIESEKEKFIFRVYRNDWRTEEEILFELELLSYLGNNAINVAAPISAKNSSLYTSIECPEGSRITVLYHYAPGCSLNTSISLAQSELLGRSVATLHQASKKFKTRYSRKTLSLPYLVDQSLVLIKPFVTTKQFMYFENIKIKIENKLSQLNEENADFGICVGDINVSNFHITKDNIITHFDFDQCGFGYRAFDIGKFSSSIHSHEEKKEILLAFIQGYALLRQLTPAEKMSIPYYEIASIIWVMSIHISNANKIGYQYLESPFWDKRIGIIKKLDDKLIN